MDGNVAALPAEFSELHHGIVIECPREEQSIFSGGT